MSSVMGLIALIGGLGFAGGRWGASLESRVDVVEARSAETMAIHHDLDTLKALLRK